MCFTRKGWIEIFTGLIEELGKIVSIRKGSASAVLTISADKVLSGTKIGDSIAVNGTCLTVTSLSGRIFSADVMAETLDKTSLGVLGPGDRVNLERAMQLGDRLDGHLVSGHIDGVGIIRGHTTLDIAIITEITVSPELIPFILPKGSIAIDGISLTVVDTKEDYFTVSLIPITAKETTLGFKKPGMKVNLETDMLGKYVHRFLHYSNTKKEEKSLSMNFLAENGFL